MSMYAIKFRTENNSNYRHVSAFLGTYLYDDQVSDLDFYKSLREAEEGFKKYLLNDVTSTVIDVLLVRVVPYPPYSNFEVIKKVSFK